MPIALGTQGNVALNLTAGANIGGAGVSGFDSTDLIENRPSAANSDVINRVTYTPGLLTLLSDGGGRTDTVTTVALAGAYTGQQFLTNFTGINYGDTDITLPGAFVTGIGPGTQTVTGSAYRLFTLITGGGNSGALTMKANIALQGAYTASSLSVVSSTAGTDDVTDILANSSLAVSGNATISSNLQLTDAGSSFTVGGLLTLGGDPSYAAQVVLAGSSSLRAANLTISSASGQYFAGSNSVPNLAVLGSSTAELGSGSLATAGTLAIDSGSTLTLAAEEGEFTASGLIDEGSIVMGASGAGSSGYRLDTAISGTGSVTVNGTLLVDLTVSGVALAVTAGELTVSGAVSGLQSLTLAASTQTSLQSLAYGRALEVGASGSLTVGGLDGSGSLTGLASLTLDAGASATFTGTVSNVGAITVGSSGSLEFDKGGSGSGVIALGMGATLKLVNGAETGWSGVTLAGQNLISTFGGTVSVPTISGFNTSDIIELTTGTFDSYPQGQYYTGASFTPGTGGSGTLTLTEDGQAVQSYTLAGTYSAGQFITYAGDNVEDTGVGSSTLTLAYGSQAGLTGATLTGDTGGSFLLLTGTGQQQTETMTGDVAITGGFTFGSVTFASTASSVSADNAVLVEAGGSVAATTAAVDDTVEVDGAGASLAVSGTLSFTDNTGASGLLVFNGATVQAGGTSTATEYDFDDVQFAVDGTGTLEIGHAGGAAQGAITVDAGSVFHTDSDVNVAAVSGMVLNGTWLADDTASITGGYGAGVSDDYFWKGNISGSGAIQVAANTFLTVLNAVTGLSTVATASGSGLTVNGSLLGIGGVTVAASSSISVAGLGTSNFSAGSLTLADAAAGAQSATFNVNNNATGTGGALTIGAHDAFAAGGTVSGWSAIAVGAGAAIEFDGSEQGSPISLATGAAIRLGTGATISGTISGFGKTNTIAYQYNTGNDADLITDATWAAGGNGLGTLTLSDDGTVVTQLTLAGNYAGEVFLANAAGEGGESVVTLADPACYCPGTLIRTARGEVAVEDLAVGDAVLTVTGASHPVVWIGRRSYGARFVLGRDNLRPVCIRAGALAPCVPERDLWVSPQHAIFVDGVLVPARCLVNGVSVVAPVADGDVHYLHVELPEQAVIWANGLPAESYVEDGNRGMFHNAAERSGAPRMPAVYCARRVEDGFEVEAVRRRMRARCAA